MSLAKELNEVQAELYTQQRALHAVSDIALSGGLADMGMLLAEDLACLMALFSDAIGRIQARVEALEVAARP